MTEAQNAAALTQPTPLMLTLPETLETQSGQRRNVYE